MTCWALYCAVEHALLTGLNWSSHCLQIFFCRVKAALGKHATVLACMMSFFLADFSPFIHLICCYPLGKLMWEASSQENLAIAWQAPAQAQGHIAQPSIDIERAVR